jgi:NAD(P)-dependent dehydrogenase (short-subunit alcohol dehydrogenase family)
MDATTLLRPHLLDGHIVVLGGGGWDSFARPLDALGAVTRTLPPTLDEEALASAVDPSAGALVHDLRPAFGDGGQDGLRAAIDLAWVAVRAVANVAFIPASHGGKVVLVAPSPNDGDPATAGVRAATENLARTLSIEWARHRITTVAITPGSHTSDEEIGALVAYLVSSAGDYWSGCRLALGELAAA